MTMVKVEGEWTVMTDEEGEGWSECLRKCGG